MCILIVAAVLQAIVLCAGILLNLLLLYVIIRFTKSNVGFYKWIMASFCFYEFTYGLAALLVMPIHFVGFRSWFAFSFHGPLSSTSVATGFMSFYCMLYGSWLGFVFCSYVYRYLSLCKQRWLDYVDHFCWLKVTLYVMFAFFLSLTTFCAFYSCRVHEPTKESMNFIKENFGNEFEKLSYIMDPVTGEVSPYGILSIVIHSTFLLAWISVIGFCCTQIYMKISFLHSIQNNAKINIAVEKQLFSVLILQTIIPLVFCDIPSIIHFTFPLYEKAAFFSQFTPLFTLSSSLPKVLDPLVSLLFIKAYRNAVKKMLGIENSVEVSNEERYLSSKVLPEITQIKPATYRAV